MFRLSRIYSLFFNNLCSPKIYSHHSRIYSRQWRTNAHQSRINSRYSSIPFHQSRIYSHHSLAKNLFSPLQDLFLPVENLLSPAEYLFSPVESLFLPVKNLYTTAETQVWSPLVHYSLVLSYGVNKKMCSANVLVEVYILEMVHWYRFFKFSVKMSRDDVHVTKF